MSIILPIEHPSLGFDPCTGETVELRFIVGNRYSNKAALIRVRGAARVRAALASIDARSIDDVRRAKAIVNCNNGVMELVHLIGSTAPAFPTIQEFLATPAEPSRSLTELAARHDKTALSEHVCDDGIKALEAAEL